MVELIRAETRIEAWLKASDLLMGGGDKLNLLLEIRSPSSEDKASLFSTGLIDDFYRSENSRGHIVYPVHTVAETIFPGWEYSKRGLRGVYESYPADYERFMRGDHSWGRYAYRMIRRVDAHGVVVNPLDIMIRRIRRSQSTGHTPFRGAYELGIIGGPLDLPLYDGTEDGNRDRGAPCLMHLSFKVVDSCLHLTALYRLHDYRYKVPGNLLGLARLQECVARETGTSIGSLVVHSTLAYVDRTKGKRVFAGLLDRVRAEIRT